MTVHKMALLIEDDKQKAGATMGATAIFERELLTYFHIDINTFR